MAKLIDAAITSLDGYIEDASGNFGWANPMKTCMRGPNRGQARCRRQSGRVACWSRRHAASRSSAPNNRSQLG
jgi:hypothetical protein